MLIAQFMATLFWRVAIICLAAAFYDVLKRIAIALEAELDEEDDDGPDGDGGEPVPEIIVSELNGSIRRAA